MLKTPAVLIAFAFITALLAGCAVRFDGLQQECASDLDCVPAECCHPKSCVPVSQAPNCAGIACTMECQPGTLDCGGSCACVNGKCVGQNFFAG